MGVCLIEFGFDSDDCCWRIPMEQAHMVDGVVGLLPGLVMEPCSGGSRTIKSSRAYEVI